MASFDPEPIEAHIATTLHGMTIAAGYQLPKDLALVTREILDYDETAGRRPAAIIQVVEIAGELVGLGGLAQSTVTGRVVFYFDLETGSLTPATWANRYMVAVHDALLVDRSRGGNPVVLTTRVPQNLTALLWRAGLAFQATVTFEVVAMHDGGV